MVVPLVVARVGQPHDVMYRMGQCVYTQVQYMQDPLSRLPPLPFALQQR